MPRTSMRAELQQRVREHLAVAETHPPSQCPLDVRSVAIALAVSPTTLYKYGLNAEINAAEERQRKHEPTTTQALEARAYQDQIRAATASAEKERERSKALVGRIAIIEANAARLGIDPEELYRPIAKPVRNVSRAGSGGGHGFRRPRF